MPKLPIIQSEAQNFFKLSPTCPERAMSIYHPLKPNEIRLLRLYSGAWHEEVQCELFQGPLIRKPIFNALSYAWGSPRFIRSILIDGKPCRVTASVDLALRRLRQTFGTTIVWVDAICIDQQDQMERNEQVSIMRDIYTSAQQVVVYLGEIQSSGVAMRVSAKKALPQTCTFFNHNSAKQVSGSSRNRYSPRSTEDFHAFRLIHAISEARSLKDIASMDNKPSGVNFTKNQCRRFESLRQLMRSRWWDRMWTLQEVVVPQNLTLIYGSCVSTWGMFLRAAEKISEFQTSPDPCFLQPDYTKVLELFSRTVLNIELMRNRWLSNEKIPLLPLLRQFSGRKSTDPRDKVYALLGLVQSRVPIEPDYMLDVTTVFRNTALGIMKTTKNLSVLNGDIGRKFRQDLPSWVPDWTAEYNDLDRRRADTASQYETSLQSSIYSDDNELSEMNYSRTLTILERLDNTWAKNSEPVQLELPDAESFSSAQPRRQSIPEMWLADECTEALGHSDWTKFMNPEIKGCEDQYTETDCLEAVEYFLMARAGNSRAQHYENGVLRLSGHKISTVCTIGPVTFGDADLTSAIQSWGMMVAQDLSGPEKARSFLTTLCAGIVYTRNDSSHSPQCRRIHQDELNSVVLWLLHWPGAPFGKSEVSKNTHLSSFRDTMERYFPVSDVLLEKHGNLDVEYSIRMATRQRAFIITNEEGFGLVPSQTSVGDFLYFFLGGSNPFVLRSAGACDVPISLLPPYSGGINTPCFQLIGDCFLYGFMDGESMKTWYELVATAVVPASLREAAREERRIYNLLPELSNAKKEILQALTLLEDESTRDRLDLSLLWDNIIKNRNRRQEYKILLNLDNDNVNTLPDWMIHFNDISFKSNLGNDMKEVVASKRKILEERLERLLILERKTERESWPAEEKIWRLRKDWEIKQMHVFIR